MTLLAEERDVRPSQQDEFVKAMTLTDATMLVAGSMIGSGIFIVSASMARQVGSPLWLLLAWILTGVITLLGALSYGELAAMYPKAGGQYVFLRESMGSLMGFLYGWTLFLVTQTGTIAAVAVDFGRFFGELVPSISAERFSWFPQSDICVAALGCSDPANAIQLGLNPQRLVAILSLVALTWISLRGVREGKFVQTTLTIEKTGALALLIALGLTLGRNAEAVAANFASGNFQGNVAVTFPFVVAFGAALVGSLFSRSSYRVSGPPGAVHRAHRWRDDCAVTVTRDAHEGGIGPRARAARCARVLLVATSRTGIVAQFHVRTTSGASTPAARVVGPSFKPGGGNSVSR